MRSQIPGLTLGIVLPDGCRSGAESRGEAAPGRSPER